MFQHCTDCGVRHAYLSQSITTNCDELPKKKKKRVSRYFEYTIFSVLGVWTVTDVWWCLKTIIKQRHRLGTVAPPLELHLWAQHASEYACCPGFDSWALFRHRLEKWYESATMWIHHLQRQTLWFGTRESVVMALIMQTEVQE